MRADGVFSGGGIKGLAFAGALEATSEAGYDEWMKLAGTSAGAITAMALAVGYDAERLRAELERVDFGSIADTGAPLGIGVVWNLVQRHGVTRGKVLHDWIRGLLKNAPQPATKFGELDGRLQVVGTDLAHARMVVFPRDVAQYVDEHDNPLDPDEFEIADAVRISAGYPYFFPPLKLRYGETGKDGVLVDGGICSTFPVFLFDVPDPQHPTWGFRLTEGPLSSGLPLHQIGGIDWPIDMLSALLDTSVNALDQLELDEDHFKARTIAIPTAEVPVLKFDLSKADQKYLRDQGYNAAKAFFASNPNALNSFREVPASIPA